jgi:ATP-dependent Lon protease
MHGDILKDSVRAVYNLIRANFREFGIPEQRLKTQTVAVHLVKIAEPKDGPSAGLAFAAAGIACSVSCAANRARNRRCRCRVISTSGRQTQLVNWN